MEDYVLCIIIVSSAAFKMFIKFQYYSKFCFYFFLKCCLLNINIRKHRPSNV